MALSKELTPEQEAAHSARKLADAERDEIAKRAEILQAVIREVDKLLVDNNVSIKEWGEIVDFFNQLTNVVIPKLTLAEIKRRITQ